MIRRLAPLVLAASLLLSPSAARAGTPDPSTFPVGEAPAVTWQSGTAVHTASGTTVNLPLGKAVARYEVLGKRGGQWIVVIPGYDAKVLAVKGTKVRTVWKHVYDEASTHYTVAEGGSLIAEVNYDRAGSTEITVFDLKGKVVAQRGWPRSVSLLDFSGDTLLISTFKATQTWAVGGKPVTVAPDALFGDLGGDLLFVNLPADTAGPTSLSAPGTPAWGSGIFIPQRLSPDGAYVAGLNFAHRKIKLEVRKVADGTVQPVPAFRAGFDTALAWEPDGALLVMVKGSQGRTLVRCTVAGACERATDWLAAGVVGFPG